MIRDRNGEPYKLRGPNPVMQTQDLWDARHLRFYNMNFPAFAHPTRPTPAPPEPDYTPPPLPKEHEITVPPPEPPRPAPVAAAPTRTMPILCLPATPQTHHDSLYGEGYQRTRYGTQRRLEGVLMEDTDLRLRFWCGEELTRGSIVYPSGIHMKRWWRVEESAPHAEGFVVTCSPSTVSPDFSG